MKRRFEVAETNVDDLPSGLATMFTQVPSAFCTCHSPLLALSAGLSSKTAMPFMLDAASTSEKRPANRVLGLPMA